MKTLDQAISRYFQVFGEEAMQPQRKLSTVSRNHTVFLRNTNGSLAVVTSKGCVFDRIGGNRLDDPTNSRRA